MEVDSLMMVLAVHLCMCPQEWVMPVPSHCEVRDEDALSGLSLLWCGVAGYHAVLVHRSRGTCSKLELQANDIH